MADNKSGSSSYLKCDGFGCDERHPLEHEELGEPSFGTGRWLGWIYVDFNRPDLWEREFRFCSVFCLQHWLDRQIVSKSRGEPTPLDIAIRRPHDELARKAAGLKARNVG